MCRCLGDDGPRSPWVVIAVALRYFWLGALSSFRVMKCECHDRAGGEEWAVGDC